MVRKTELAALAQAIGDGLGLSPVSPELQAFARQFARHASLDIARALFAEARAKRPKDRRIDGYLFLLGGAADELRLSGNGGSTEARNRLAELLTLIGAESAKGDIDPGALMAVARTLTHAGVAPPAALQTAMVSGMEAARTEPRDRAEAPAADGLAEIIAEFGNDAFAVYSEMAAAASAFPVAQRIAMIHALAQSDAPAARAAALGFVLDVEDQCAMAAIAGLVEDAGARKTDSLTIARLARIRPWLAEARRKSIDLTLTILRRNAEPPIAAIQGAVQRCLATPADGAGAQSLFALIKRGRKWEIASVLVKEDAGVADAWATEAMPKAEADAMVAHIVAEADAAAVSQDYLLRRIGDALAVNLAGAPPPFGLVQVLEAMGVGPLAPQRIAPARLLEELLMGLSADKTGGAALQRAHAASVTWAERIDTLASWFEAGDWTDALLRPLKSNRKRAAAMLETLLPTRREFWASRCAWTAAAWKEAAPLDPLWLDMALVGRAIAGDAPLVEIPLMTRIAADSAAAFAAR